MGRVPSSSLPLAAHRSISVRESNPSSATAESLRRSTSSHSDATPLIEVGIKGSMFSLIDKDVRSSQPSQAPAAAAQSYHSAPPRKPWQLGIRNGSRRNPAASDDHQSKGKLQAAAAKEEATVRAAAGSRVPKWKRFLHKVTGHAKVGASRPPPRGGGDLKVGSSGVQAGAVARPPRDCRLIWERRNVAQIAPLQVRKHH